MTQQKIAVVGIVEFEDRVLVGKKIGKNGEVNHGEWHIPGGKAAPHETPEQAIRREIMEETRVSIEIERLLDQRVVPDLSLEVKWFLCRALSDVVIAGDDLAEAKFVSKSELRKICSEKAISLWPPKVVEYLDGK